MTKIVNLFGGPCTGKSTVAAGLFYKMKVEQLSVELVTEYAKDLMWDDRGEFLRNPDQLYIFAQQYRRVYRLLGKVDYVITDSPILLSSVYVPDQQHIPMIEEFIYHVWNSFDNQNFVLTRNTEYVEDGRAHSENESIAIDDQIVGALNATASGYNLIDPFNDAPNKIFHKLNK